MFLAAREEFSYLKALGEETASTVRELTEGDILAVYEDEPNLKNDGEVWERYEKAVEACRIWIRAVLAIEAVNEKEKDISAEVSLILPDRRLEAAIYTCEFPFGGGRNAEPVEKIHTPIGTIDFHTYRTIMDIPNNPVTVLYRYFRDLLHLIHHIIAMPLHLEGDEDVLNREMVAEEGIVDVLGVSVYDSLWYDVDVFLSARFAPKEVS